jgi:large subunit ribosomal protein L21
LERLTNCLEKLEEREKGKGRPPPRFHRGRQKGGHYDEKKRRPPQKAAATTAHQLRTLASDVHIRIDALPGSPVYLVFVFSFGGMMYAVIKTGGKQYRVAPGDTIRIERVDGKVGENVTFGSVLAVHNGDKKILHGEDAGKASVTGTIVAQDRAKKVIVLKFKKTNQYKIRRGHRQNYTSVKVGEIKL